MTTAPIKTSRTLEALREALALLDDGKRWIKGAMRRYQEDPERPGIIRECYCATGAASEAVTQVAARDHLSERAASTLRLFVFQRLNESMPYGLHDASIAFLNDLVDTKWATVRGLFLRAIRAEAELIGAELLEDER